MRIAIIGDVKIIIPGGTGQVGNILARSFQSAGHEVVMISRNPSTSRLWPILSWADIDQVVDKSDVVINLAGRSVNCRYNAANRKAIIDSRTTTTRAIGQAIQRAQKPPRLWLQMSTATIYAHRYDTANDEATGILGTVNDPVPDTWRFSHDVALTWERAAVEIETPKTRKVLLRTALVLSPDRGGVFDVLLGLVRRGLGGTNGDGRQFVSWIHDHDFVNATNFVIEHDDIEGPVNLAAPHPLPNRQFMAALRQAAQAPFGLPATNWMLELGALFLRTETELILKSRRVIPSRLLENGFNFEHPEWPEAARELYQRWK